MSNPLSASAQRVQDALQALGLPCEVLELPQSTRSAADAAQTIGCTVGQIVKSLVFRAASGRAILVLASGANRVNERLLSSHLGEAVAKADADFVRAQTGYAIGGVPPLGHVQPLTALIDRTLLGYDVLWAAAGTPHSVFKLTPADLLTMTGGQVLDLV